MRLPGVSLACALWLVWFAASASVQARAAAHESDGFANCLDLSGPAAAELTGTGMTGGEAKPGDDVLPAAARPLPVPTPLDGRDLADRESYEDVFRILSEENECSRFYGGPARAAEAFNQFAQRLERRRLDDPSVALRMSGSYTRYRNQETGAAYRVFDRAVINLDGPIGLRPPSLSASRAAVGRYAAYTPKARALVLLHELGHLIEKPSGGWLLRNDGHDSDLSERNTREIEAQCFEQLEAVRD